MTARYTRSTAKDKSCPVFAGTARLYKNPSRSTPFRRSPVSLPGRLHLVRRLKRADIFHALCAHRNLVHRNIAYVGQNAEGHRSIGQEPLPGIGKVGKPFDAVRIQSK